MPHDLQFEVAADVEVPVDVARLRATVTRLLDGERPRGAALAVQFGSDDLLRALNREHRGVDEPTDVLSFAAEEGEPFPTSADAEEETDYLGDVVVSVEYAHRAARAAGIDLDAEVEHIVVHGVLHLLGYDHETDADAAAMEALEEGLLGSGIHAGREHADG